jgi:hypothetical protein
MVHSRSGNNDPQNNPDKEGSGRLVYLYNMFQGYYQVTGKKYKNRNQHVVLLILNK